MTRVSAEKQPARSCVTQPTAKKQKRMPLTVGSSSQKFPTVKPIGETQQTLYRELSKRKVLPNKYVDLSVLELLKVKDDFLEGLEDMGWSGLINMDEPSYAPLTYEFLSSFNVTDHNTLSFRIANVSHEITKAELADMFGWKLIEQQPLPENYATPFWLKLTRLPNDESYMTQRALSSEILCFSCRYFARLMSFTMYGRGESNNKVQTGELALLYHFDEGLPVDWTNLLICRFLYQAKRTKGAIVMGGFITRIAEKLGVFDRNRTNLKVADGWPAVINVEYLLGMRMLYRSKYGPRPLYHPRLELPVEEPVVEPKLTLKEQVAKLQQGQKQLLKNQEVMAKHMASMMAFMKQHLPQQAP
ncbi:hypothetical protein POM88_040687 [Heracleum sosnowskyi]|uniref:Uncharacterized protein n=1 Tax=Heracleum sosnowskyi TaxID=360622 RepID=A0AAD8HEJ3_9APIA|nr:hypothetical protein POM88_040687 [Heracleum sosnowskyi]